MKDKREVHDLLNEWGMVNEAAIPVIGDSMTLDKLRAMIGDQAKAHNIIDLSGSRTSDWSPDKMRNILSQVGDQIVKYFKGKLRNNKVTFDFDNNALEIYMEMHYKWTGIAQHKKSVFLDFNIYSGVDEIRLSTKDNRTMDIKKKWNGKTQFRAVADEVVKEFQKAFKGIAEEKEDE